MLLYFAQWTPSPQTMHSNKALLSEKLDLPLQFCYQENEITIEYTLTACVYNNQSGVYKCDDLNEETAVLKSNDPTTPSGLSHRLH